MRSVLLDTSFLIRLLNSHDPLHKNAVEYYKYFIENDIVMKFSTISIAEFCARDEFENLPIKDLQIIPFNVDHARIAGKFANSIFIQKIESQTDVRPRAIIPNDSKLFAQAHLDKTITHFVTSDSESGKTIALLNKQIKTSFTFVDINIPVNEVFGTLF